VSTNSDDAIPLSLPDEFSGTLDIGNLVRTVERSGHDTGTPPELVDRPVELWGFASGLHSDLLYTSAQSDNTETWEKLAEEFGEESQLADDPALKAALAADAGRILVERLGRREAGEVLMRESGSGVAAALLTLREDRDDGFSDLAECEARAQDASISADDRATAWIEFGTLCEEKTGDRERAMEAYMSALLQVPRHPVAAALATDAAVMLADHDRAIAFLNRQLEGAEGKALRVATLLDLADFSSTSDERHAFLLKAHETNPEEETALRRLIRSSVDRASAPELAALYVKLASVSEDAVSSATALHLGLLSMLEGELDPDPVVQEVLDRARDGRTEELLAPLSEVALYLEQRSASGAPDGMAQDAALLKRLADSIDAPRERALVRLRLARIRIAELDGAKKQRGGLSEEARAIAELVETDLEYCLAHLPRNQWVRTALARVLEMQGDVDRLVTHLQAWARSTSAGPGRAAVLMRLGRVHEEVRGDLPRAAEVYELALAEDPEAPDALRALGRVYEKMRRWPQAIANLQRQARQSNDRQDRLRALRRVAVMAQQELGDSELAVATLEQIADADPDDLLALYSLVAMCRIQGRTSVLVRTLRTLVERLDDEVAQTAALVELGEALELQLKRRDEARAAYERALRLTPGYGPALRALARIYRDEGDLEALLGMQEPEFDNVTDPAVLALKAARICEDEIGDLDRALEYLKRAYELDPDVLPARQRLIELLSANGKMREVYDLLRAQDDPRTPAALADRHYRLGLIAESLARSEPEDARARLDAALQHYRFAEKTQPTHELAGERARRLIVAANDHDNLAAWLSARIDRSEGDRQSALLVQLARLHASRPDGIAAARDSLEKATQAAPSDPVARRQYESLLRQAGDVTTLPSVYLQAAINVTDTHLKATLLVEAAELLLQTGKIEDRDLAGTAILDALKEDPGNPYAVRHLERLLGAPNPPMSVKDAVAARAVRAQSDAERAIFYLESAELLEASGSYKQARRAYQAALGAIPRLLPADAGIKRVTGLREGEGVAAASQAASLHIMMAQAREAAVRAGATGGENDARTAVTQLAQILARDPNHRDALALARALTQQLQDPTPAIGLLKGAFGNITEPQLRYDIALLLSERSGEARNRIQFLLQAVEAKPDGRAALHKLVTAYESQGHASEAARATERLLGLYPADDPTAIDLRIGLAQFLASDPASLTRSLEHARRVFAARPEEPRTINLMADLLERTGQSTEAASLLERLAGRERDAGSIHKIQLRRAKLLMRSGGDPTPALAAAEQALSLNSGHRETVAVFVGLAQQMGRGDRIAAFLPSIRGSVMGKIGRGALSLRDLKMLRDVSMSIAPAVSNMANCLCYALDPNSVPRPPTYLRPINPTALAGLLVNQETRNVLVSPNEPAHVSELLSLLDGALSKIDAFESIGTQAQGLPAGADVRAFASELESWSRLLGLGVPQVVASRAHNAAVLHSGSPPTLRIGENLWMQGDATAWRGLAAVTLARHVWGAPQARSLTAMEMDLAIAAAFETAQVFNAITADPDPRRLEQVAGQLDRHLQRRQRKALENTCNALSGTDFAPAATARAVLATDLRLAVLVTGDIGGCLGAASLLDGVAGGSLKQRVNRSTLAQGLTNWILSDRFAELRANALR
jgi:tetratricopeptide (TPR) repeat protein